MFTNITRTTLCITAFSIASLMAAPLNATKTESLDWNWKFARFGKMPDGSTQPEPGKAMGFATATSEESGNPADNAVDGDKSTRWCASSGKSGEKITVDMGRPVDVKTVNILWENKATIFSSWKAPVTENAGQLLKTKLPGKTTPRKTR